MASRMYATLVSKSGQFESGDLVCVEVPSNCTIHSPDAVRLARLRTLAMELREARGRGVAVADLGGLVDAIAEVAWMSDYAPDDLPFTWPKFVATGGPGGSGAAGTGAAGGGSGGGGITR